MAVDGAARLCFVGRMARQKAKADRQQAQTGFLVMAIMDAVTELLQAKCGTLTGLEKYTLRRRIEKAVKQFIAR